MYLFRKIVFDCKQATLLSAKKEEGKITLLERTKLSYHLWYCDPCRRFIKQWARIRAEIRAVGQSKNEEPPFTLSDSARNRIQGQLDQFNS